MPREPVPGVRGAALQKDDPLTTERLLSVISPYTALLLSGREVEADSDGRRFEVALTFDRTKAVAASTLLLGRLTESAGADAVEVSDLVEFATVMQELVGESQRTEEVARPLLAAMARLTGLESTFLSRVSDGEYQIRFSENKGSLEVKEGASLPWSHAVCKRAIDVGRRSFADVQAELPEDKSAGEYGFRTFVTCPVTLEDGRVIGTLCGASSERGGVEAEKLAMVQSFADLIASHLSAGVDQEVEEHPGGK